jgi:hypothetical protein
MLTAPQMSIALSAMYRSFSTGRRWLPAAALGLSLFLLPCAAFAKKIRDEAPAQQQPAARAPVASASISKTVAVESTIVALAANGSDAAEQTLEKVVTGEIKFGGHDKQAAQLALVQLIMKPTPRSEAFVLRLFTDPDESIRPVDKSDYPGNVVRSDAANIVAKVGSPSLRLALAKAYSTSVQAPVARTAIEGILRTPHPANFAAQIAILRSPKVSPLLKMELQKLVFEKNESAVKQALRLEAAAPPVEAGNAAMSFPGGMPSAAGGSSFFGTFGKMFGIRGSSSSGPASMAAGPMPGFPAMAGGFPMAAPAGVKSAGQPPAINIDPRSTATAVTSSPRVSLTGQLSEADRQRMIEAMQRAQAAKGASPAPIAAAPQAAAIPSAPSMGALPAASSATSTMQTPTSQMIEMVSKMQSLRPIDATTVAREVWTTDFVTLLSNELDGAKRDEPEVVAALASVPLTESRDKLKEFLQKHWGKGPLIYAKTEVVTPTEDTPKAQPVKKRKGKADDEDGGGGLAGGVPRRGMGMTFPGLATQQQGHRQVVEFGNEWFDPGSLLALKEAGTYTDRPKEKPKRHTTTPQYGYYQGRGTTPARAEKKAREKAEKDVQYDWRDAVEKFVRQLNERFGAAAKDSTDLQAESSGTAADESKSGSPAAGAASKSAAKTPAADLAKGPAVAATPNPAVPMPVPLHAGGKIAKEFHAQWPQDLPAGLDAQMTEPLTVHYVRFEGPGDLTKVISHYRGVVSSNTSAKFHIAPLHEVEDGKWLDIRQDDAKTHRTRSIDVIATRKSADDDGDKKAKSVDLTVEVLVVEIGALAPDKKKVREATSTTAR